jgi:NAD+ synthase (glutamine-hydrolysing)
MKIALEQINTTTGAVRGNVDMMLAFAEKARDAGADLIAFHELCIPGYPPKGLIHRREFVSANLTQLERLKDGCRGIGVVCGFIEREGEGRSERLYNAVALLHDGEIVARHRKNLLSAFTDFDERWYFKAGQGSAIADFKGVRIGLAISEDVWADKDFTETSRRRTLPGRLLNQGAQVLIVVGASPFWPCRARERERAARATALRYGLPVIFVNQVGGNDSVIFDGGSFAVAPDGKIIVRARRFEEDLMLVDLESSAQAAPLEEDEAQEVRRALALGLQDFVHKCGFQKVVLGLSGGIDSAVVACIAAEALGKENVLALILPSMYSSAESLRDAEVLAGKLGVETRTVSIKPIYHSYIESLKDAFQNLPENVTEENIQARIRGNLLMAFSNKLGHLVLATGNRSEAMTGYCTLYGDAAGGLAVVADVPKTVLYQIAETFNEEKEIIPRSIFTKAPSAELKPNQKDADTLPAYPVLDPILAALLDERKTPEEIVASGYERDTVRDVVRRISRSEHKRRQSPPALFVSRGAYIPGRAKPIAAEMEGLV